MHGSKTGSNICFYFAEHLSKTNAQCDDAAANCLDSSSCLSKFLSNLIAIGTTFEKSIFSACENFSVNLKERVKDEKLAQYYQTLNNYVMKFVDGVQRKFENLQLIAKQIRMVENEFIKACEASKLAIKGNEQELSAKLNEFNFHYSNLISPLRESFIDEDTFSDKTEQCCFVLHKALEKQFEISQVMLESQLSHLTQYEADLKESLKQSAIKTIYTLTPTGSDEYISKLKNIEDNFEKFETFYENVQKDNSTEFSRQIFLKRTEIRPITHSSFAKLNSLIQTTYYKNIREKIVFLEKKISPREKIFVELLIERMYCLNSEIANDIFERLTFVFSAQRGIEYFILNLLYKKATILLEKPYTPITLKKDQVKNFQQIAHILMIHQLEKEDKNEIESFYHFLKFCLTVFNESKECLIEMLSRSPLMHESKFWHRMTDYLTSTFSRNNTGVDSNMKSGPGMLLEGLKGIINQSSAKGMTGRNQPKYRAFEEIAFLLFKIKMDYENISEILLTLSQSFAIDYSTVKNILHQNQDMYFSQLIQTKIFSNNTREMFRSNLIKTRHEKLLFIFRHSAGFFDDAQYVISIKMLNQFFFRASAKLAGSMLLRSLLSDRDRKLLILIKTQTKNPIKLIREDFKPSEVDQIISLDVKRTFSAAPSFSQSGLETILYNVSHKNVGNFPYYQGLNYITSYFYVLFEGNKEITYALIIKMMFSSFFPYVDNELCNMKKLFFIQKRLLKYYLPTLSNYFENDQKLNTDVVVASWCLTLFTTVTQYMLKSELLDEIIDIFVAKEWPGFFQVTLVIFDELAPKLLASAYEDIFIILTELVRTNFAEIRENPKYLVNDKSTFSFKQKISKFKGITKKSLLMISCEFEDTMHRLEEYWTKVSRKLRSPKK